MDYRGQLEDLATWTGRLVDFILKWTYWDPGTREGPVEMSDKTPVSEERNPEFK